MLGNKGWMIALATVVLSAGSAQAQIKVGITMSGSGPGAALGQPQTKTVAALPKEIAGQKITYFALDDESDPTKGAQNARKLITDDVLANLAVIGDPGVIASRLAQLVETHRPTSIGVCLRTPQSLQSRLNDFQEVFARMSKLLSS